MNRHADGEYPLGAPMGTVGGPRYSEGLEAASLPRGRKNLIGYFYALHDALEKEFNYSAEQIQQMSDSDLKRSVDRLSRGLEDTPRGEDKVERAKKNAPAAYKQLSRMTGGKLAGQDQKQAGRKGLKDLDPRKWYVSTEDGDTYGPYSNKSQAGDDGDAAFRGTTDFVVERGDKVRDSVLDPKNFGLFSPRELMKSAAQKLAGQWFGKTAEEEDLVDPAEGELGKSWFKTDEPEEGEADSGSGGAAHLFFDNPLTRETREFAQSKADSNHPSSPDGPKTPPTPSEIRDKEPGGEAFSTLNRLVIKTDHPTDEDMPEGLDDVEKSEQVLKQAWFGKTAASTPDTAQGRLDDLCLGICTMGMAKDTPLLGKPTHDHSYGPAGARVEAIWKGRPYELVAYFHSSSGKLSGSCTVVFAESGDSDSFDWSGGNRIKDIAKQARKMIEKVGSGQP